MWYKAKFNVPSTFSYRIGNSADVTAISAPFPSFSAIRLGIVSTAIRTKGIHYGELVFNLIKTMPIKIGVPERYSKSRIVTKRLKWDVRGDVPGSDKSATNTVGFREYIMTDYIEIYFKIDKKPVKKVLEDVLSCVRYWGTGNSLVSLISFEEVSEGEPTENTVKHFMDATNEELSTGKYMTIELFDINPKLKFSDLTSAFKGEKNVKHQEEWYIYNMELKDVNDRFEIYQRTDIREDILNEN